MTKLLVLACVLVDFSAFTAYAIATHGVVGFLEAAIATPAALQVLLDVAIALTLVLIWMSRDAKERGLPFWPYAIATLFLGSIAPLGYLIHREARERSLRAATA
jgi:hypothetical protein